MGISDVGMIFKFVGGLGMFLFGMDMMAKGLQQSAGDKMKQWLGVLTRNRLMAVLAGALITAVIQSSSATTVMVVGFVNCGTNEPDAGDRCYHGRQYRHHRHRTDHPSFGSGRG